MSKQYRTIVEGIPPSLKGYSIYTKALHLMVDQRNALIADDWETLRDLANQGLGLVYTSYKEILRKLGRSYAISSEVNKEFKILLESYAENPETREEFFRGVKDGILNLDPNINQEILDGIMAMAEGKLEKGNPVTTMLDTLPERMESHEVTEIAINATCALAARSLMALAYTNFHQHNKTIAQVDFSLLKEDLLNSVKKEVETFEAELDAYIKKIYEDLVSGESPEIGAENLIRLIEKLIPRFGRIQATIRKYALTLKATGKGSTSEKVGNLAAMAGGLTRTAITAYSAAYYLSQQYNAVNKSSKVKALIKQAPRIGYDTGIPNGKNTEISKVGQLNDGDYVEVAGFVDSIQTGRDSDDKLITQVRLYDPSSKSSVVTAGIYVHLRHLGLVEGAYCRVSGNWQSQSGLNNGNPAIEIQKLPINDLSKKSWKIAFLDIADKFIDRWPGSLNIQFGLSPHKSYVEEGIASEILGASEIIFRRFIK